MSVAVRRALHGKLRGDTTLMAFLAAPPAGYTKSTWDDIAPQGAEPAYIVVSLSSGVPMWALGGLAMDDDLWLLKGVDRGPTADTADAIADRLAVLLNDAALSISGRTHRYLRRESKVRYAEVVDGVVWRHSGHLFRLKYE